MTGDLTRGGELDFVAAPARRALDRAGIRSFADLAKARESDLAALHGMGPNALGKLRARLAERGLGFAPED